MQPERFHTSSGVSFLPCGAEMATAWLQKRLAALESFQEGEDVLEPTLKSPKREDPYCGYEVADTLREFVSKGLLTDIDLSGTTPEEEIGDVGVANLTTVLLGKAQHIQGLSLRRVGLGAAGFREARTVAGICGVRSQAAGDNTAGVDGLRGNFCEALDDARCLKVLELRGCGLRDQGLEPLCDVLERFDEALRPVVSVQQLSLSTNHLTAAAARRMARMLATNLKLEELDISDNELREEGGEHLAGGLNANKGRLQRLNISHNLLRVAGARPLLERFMTTDSRLRMQIRRLPGTKHGFVLDGMVVTGLEFMGWVEQHNNRNRSEAVFAGDRIVEVSGKTTPEDMLLELTVGEVLDVTLLRDGVCMKHLDICYNLLGKKGTQELHTLAGITRQGNMIGNQLRFDGGTRITLLNAY
ncbi:NOD2 [Symbiodinium necroappetens]|uniref:NOD2 protein n=1 Tax=Symbiodinium necroappetens TaxID=1628268 RepID=A0A812P9S2_9DINO|nr:NOD2 [Symbiodinium necroappetens]